MHEVDAGIEAVVVDGSLYRLRPGWRDQAALIERNWRIGTSSHHKLGVRRRALHEIVDACLTEESLAYLRRREADTSWIDDLKADPTRYAGPVNLYVVIDVAKEIVVKLGPPTMSAAFRRIPRTLRATRKP